MTSRDGGRMRTAMRACTGRPIAARSTSRLGAADDAAGAQGRVRSSAVVGETPTAVATSRLLRPRIRLEFAQIADQVRP